MPTMLDGSTNGADLEQRLTVATTGALEHFAVHLGSRLGLYEELDRRGPLTVRVLAERSGIHGRYAREWLELQAVAGLLTFADDRPRCQPSLAARWSIRSTNREEPR